MKTSKTFTRLLGGSMAATALAGGAMLAQAPVASASSDSDWDRLAECESNGNWSIDTGNGFYGGLQFQQSSWEAVGGSGNPAHASKAEQIDRAEQLRQIQGWGAWPACSAALGLSGSPSGTPSSGGNGGGESAPQQQTQQAPQQQETQQAPQPQEQPQQQAPQQVQQAPEQQPQAEAPQQSYAPAGDVEVGEETYTVQSGDSLTSIANDLGIDWTDLWSANADTVEDPNLIFVGDQLLLPVVN